MSLFRKINKTAVTHADRGWEWVLLLKVGFDRTLNQSIEGDSGFVREKFDRLKKCIWKLNGGFFHGD